MLRIIAACLRACSRILSLIIKIIEKKAQHGRQDQHTQTDVSIPPKSTGSMFKGIPTSPAPKAKAKGQTLATDAKASASTDDSSKIVYPPCPQCNETMIVKRAPRGGTFLGCPQWPKCKGTRSGKEIINKKLE